MTPALAAIVFATPLFGFSLTPPAAPELTLDLAESPPPSPIGAPRDPVFTLDHHDEAAPPDAEDPAITEAIRQRRQMSDIHRAFGIATWASMAMTAVFGVLQIHDEYGFFADENDTPCARGEPIFDFCGEGVVPWPHAIAAGTTTVLYATTFILSFTMPDPLDIASSDTPHGERLRIHKALRWAHLAGVLALAVLGGVTANIDADYEVRRALAWAHAGTAVTTFGLLTAAGAIMVF